MRKLILILFLLIPGYIYANPFYDVQVQVRFKKVMWKCPACGNEEAELMNVKGGNSYEHTCSKCGKGFNQSGDNMWVCEGAVNTPIAEYNTLKSEEIDTKVNAQFDEQLYQKKNPAPYVEPTPEIIQKLIDDKQEELSRLTVQKAEAVAKIEAIEAPIEEEIIK